METEIAAGASQVDFSLLSLFFQATPVVKIVMVMLIAASIWCWSIIFQKFGVYRKAKRDSDRFDRAFWSGEPLDQLFAKIGGNPKGANERIFTAAMEEWERSYRGEGLISGAQQRIDRSMDVAIARESERLNHGLTFLATVGSTAPFVGLFGTVWGIKHAFEEIAIAQNTNLAVVAPGIAEALVATALGLLAAIPAVIFYNKLSTDVDRLIGGYDSFSDEFATIISRQMDA